jgi:hypothetical protein
LKKTLTERLNENILGALEGPFAALSYFSSTKVSEVEYSHWGLEKTYGKEEVQLALRAAHTSVFLNVLKTPIPKLVEEITESDRRSLSAILKAKEIKALIPSDQGPGSANHLKLVLYVLSCLAPKLAASNPGDAFQSQPPAR